LRREGLCVFNQFSKKCYEKTHRFSGSVGLRDEHVVRQRQSGENGLLPKQFKLLRYKLLQITSMVIDEARGVMPRAFFVLCMR